MGCIVIALSTRPLVAEAVAEGLTALGLRTTARSWLLTPRHDDVVVVVEVRTAEDAQELLRLDLPAPGARTVLVVDTWTRQHALLADAWSVAGAVEQRADLTELAHVVRAAEPGHRSTPAPALGQTGPFVVLTDREHQVLVLIAAGARNAAVATELGISPHTVRTHVQNLLGKFGAPNRLAAAALAREQGLLDVPHPAGRA